MCNNEQIQNLKPFDEERYAIQHDIILVVPDRVAKNSIRFKEVEDADKQAEIGSERLSSGNTKSPCKHMRGLFYIIIGGELAL